MIKKYEDMNFDPKFGSKYEKIIFFEIFE